MSAVLRFVAYLFCALVVVAVADVVVLRGLNPRLVYVTGGILIGLMARVA